jgi:seryl-tRNA synthetase
VYAVKWLIKRIMGVHFLVEAGFCWCPAQKIIQNHKRVEIASSVTAERTMNLTTYLHQASQLRLAEGLSLPWRRSGVCAADTDFTDVI